MIIVNLTGGLGNQMFQYAFGKKIATKLKTDLKLHFTDALFNTKRPYALDVYNVSASMATTEDLRKLGIIQNRVINRVQYLITERLGIQFNRHIVTQKYPYIFDSKYFSIKNDSYIQGFWQDIRYFKDIEDILRKEFTPKKRLDEKNQKIFKKIQESTSVSIHVRRGDLITNKANARFIGLNYYIKNINKINKLKNNSIFFVFSDDISWCKQNLNSFMSSVYYIDNNKGKESYKDLFLMSSCKHNIIANSSFSLWGAWLNQNKNKILIKP